MLGSNLQNMLSINVPFLFENRVGRFMLVSPAKIRLAFCLSINSRTGVNSSINSLRMSLPGFGGLYKGKAHKNCIIGKILCLRHIIGTTFITRMTLYVYIVEGFKTSQNIYTFI